MDMFDDLFAGESEESRPFLVAADYVVQPTGPLRGFQRVDMLELGRGEDDTIGEVSFKSICDAIRLFDMVFEIRRDPDWRHQLWKQVKPPSVKVECDPETRDQANVAFDQPALLGMFRARLNQVEMFFFTIDVSDTSSTTS